MTSLHYRSASATDRRSAQFPSGTTRINGHRTARDERPSTGSPVLPDGFSEPVNGNSSFSKAEKRLSGLEQRRREKTTVTTTETLYTRRSPKKELPNNGGSSRDRRSVVSPVLKHQSREDSAVPPPPPPPWAPSVSLVPHSSAPLAVRVTAPPLSRNAPADLDPVPLESMSMQEQERTLLDDLLYVFMGFEGQYIRFHDTYDPRDEKERLNGPVFHALSGFGSQSA